MGYPTSAQGSGQFSFNSFRSYWVSSVGGAGSDYGAHIKAWEGQTYYAPGGAATLWPSSNMHMFLFYNAYATSVSSGGGK